MTPMMTYEIFKRSLPYYIPHVIRYKGSKKSGGIDIWMDDHTVLNFQTQKDGGWILKKGGDFGIPKGD